MTTPADELEAAAKKLRAAATGARGNDAAWRYTKGMPNDSVRTEGGWEIAYGDDLGTLEYIALMHPGAGSALAAWLESTAVLLRRSTHPAWQEHVAQYPLAVARQLLGTIPAA